MDTFMIQYLDESSSEESILFTSSSSSSSESESGSEDELLAKKARVEDYLDVIEKYSDVQFKEHFRLNRVVADGLIDKYRDYKDKEIRGGREEVSAAHEIYLTLWYLANTETYRQISDRFDVTKSSVFRILHRVIEWIVLESHNYIKWPSEYEMAINQAKFCAMQNFPRVIGAIDGSHIMINQPRHDKGAYYNRKKYYSILIQGIVDANKRFIDVHCGEPGSMHDARLLRKSYFYRKICEEPEIIIPGGILLGDSAYPESDYLVTPYKDFGNLTQQQIKFNYMHSATRFVVENAFGLLKGRFRRLKFFESPNIGFIVNCVVAACILHNICIMENDLEDWMEPEDPSNNEDSHISSQEQSRSSTRQQIFNYLDSQNLLN